MGSQPGIGGPEGEYAVESVGRKWTTTRNVNVMLCVHLCYRSVKEVGGAGEGGLLGTGEDRRHRREEEWHHVEALPEVPRVGLDRRSAGGGDARHEVPCEGLAGVGGTVDHGRDK